MDDKAFVYATAHNGITVRIPADRYPEWKKRQEELARGENPADTRETSEMISSIFKGDYQALIETSVCKHYTSICEMLSKSTLVKNAKFEVLPIMVVFADFASANHNVDREEIFRCILSSASKVYPIYSNLAKLDLRTDLYGSIIRGKEIRGEWFPPDFLTKSDIRLYSCIIALGDILINPACADDYDNAPILIHNFSDVFSFSTEIMPTVFNELTSYFNEICSILENTSILAKPQAQNSATGSSASPEAKPSKENTPQFIDKRNTPQSQKDEKNVKSGNRRERIYQVLLIVILLLASLVVAIFAKLSSDSTADQQIIQESLNAEITQLTNNYEKLSSKFDKLSNDYDILESNYSNLSRSFSASKKDIANLKSNFDVLLDDYMRLYHEYHRHGGSGNGCRKCIEHQYIDLKFSNEK